MDACSRCTQTVTIFTVGERLRGASEVGSTMKNKASLRACKGAGGVLQFVSRLHGPLLYLLKLGQSTDGRGDSRPALGR